MKVISWNVNSIRVRLEYVLEILKREKPDCLCIQETKITDNLFPQNDFKKLDYFSYFKGISSYNGVAIISKKKVEKFSSLDFCKKNDARHIAIEINGIEIISLYVPAGGDNPDPTKNKKFRHKLNFLEELDDLLVKKKGKKVVLCGDLNIAPKEDDVWSHKQLINVVSHTQIERERLNKILVDNNYIDSVRHFLNPPENVFTWWSYRSPNFQKNNRGRRLDHIWTSNTLKKKLKSAQILKHFRTFYRPSDHVPISVTLDA